VQATRWRRFKDIRAADAERAVSGGTLVPMTEQPDEQDRPRRPRRPRLQPGPGRVASAAPSPEDVRARAEALAEAVRGAAGNPDYADTVRTLDERVGLDALAEVWADADPETLPGVLWALYLLRAWCTRQPSDVARLYSAGRRHAPVPEVVAGVPESPTAADLTQFADALVESALRDDLDVALARGAAFSRIVAAGRADLAGTATDAAADRLALGNLRCAERLDRAAVAYRAGRL
jgi:hypothetical protein